MEQELEFVEPQIDLIIKDDENYSKYAQWCNENNAFIAEIEPTEEGTRQFQIKAIPAPDFEELKAAKLNGLSQLTDKIFNSQDTYLTSSLGFRINARSKALEDINSLIILGDEVTYFNDFDDVIHELNIDELKTLQREVIKSGQYIYSQKWEYREKINNSKTIEELNNIVFDFKYADFSK